MDSENAMKNKRLMLFFGIAATAIVAGVAAYFQFGLPGSPKTQVSMSVALQKTKEIDRLYTGVYLIPVLDRKFGTLKRDKPKEWINTAREKLGMEAGAEVQKVVKGYCKKRYEVSVGYDNISALLSDKELVANACAGRTEKLPAPRILAVNCRNTETRGDYGGNDICHRWDRDEAMRMSMLNAEMRNNNITEKVNMRGRESLKTLATLFCE